jgi:ferrochelatase
MDPLDFLHAYDPDQRALNGDRSPSALSVEEGDRVGIVLFNLGGPKTLDDVESFLYNMLMDPALLDLPVGGRVRHWLAKLGARVRAETLREHYEAIGGGSPLTRLTAEQARSLERHLNERYGNPTGVDFHTYRAMRYWHPSSREAVRQMAANEIDKVVLLPLYPQYSRATTGSSLSYWQTLEDEGTIPSWPTTTVPEYAANPKYVQAVSERIDEALQRFPEGIREDAALVFSAHGTPFTGMGRRSDPYCCLVHSTVEQVMNYRDEDRPHHTAFQSLIGPSYWLTPSTANTVRSLADRGHRAVLVVPISFVTDHVNTSYELDIELREDAHAHGIVRYEVTAGLNTHPLFIEALGEAAVAQLELPLDANQLRFEGDGLSQTYPLRSLDELPRHSLDPGTARCPSCGGRTGARRWTRSESSPDPNPSREHPAKHDDSAG